jgi:signal transduction histidine kinase
MLLNWNAIPNLLCSAAIFSVGLFVYSQRRKSQIGLSYLLLTSSAAVWQLGTFFVLSSASEQTALLFCRLTYFGSLFIPFTTFHFSLAILDEDRQHRGLIIVTYLVGILIFLPLSQTPWFISGVYSYPWGYWWKCSFGHMVFLGFLSVLMTASFYKLWQGLRSRKSQLAKKRLWYALFALMVAYLGAIDYLPNYGVKIYPLGYIFLFFYILLTAYAIARYRLLDVELIIKRTLVFAGLFGVIMAAISIITVITQGYLGQALGIGPMTRQILSVLIAMALFDPTRKYLTYLTDSYLFQKKEDFKVILNRLAKNIVTILDLHAVAETVLNTLQESLRLEAGAVLIRNEKGGEYSILSSFNLTGLRKEFLSDSEYIRYFSDPGKIINLESLEEKKNLPDAVQLAMDSLKAVIAVPLFVQSGLAGLLLMGKKKSDQEFTQEEIDYLPTIASQTAIALKNAQLVDDVIREREEKIIAQNKAEQVNYASSLSHETGNALVGITSTSQNISGGLVQDLRKLIKHCETKLDVTLRKRYEEIADKIYRFSKVIEQNSEKIRVIIKTATGGLKDNRSEKEEISFRFVWNHAKKEASISDVRYDGQMPDPFVVFGNTSLLTRVLVNLFINSRDAMLSLAGERCIHLEASYRDFEGRQVAWVEYWDDGPGVPEELFGKVFEQGFSTKPKPTGPMGLDSGYGQGLYYCRKFIEDFHKGRIWLEKNDAGGSKFVFWIPVDKEGNGENK